MIKIKRVYDPQAEDDGYRILVDRLWPRGIAKEQAKIDLWLKEIAPSNELRTWFGHDSEKWPGFKKKYKAELTKDPTLLEKLRTLAKSHTTITLLYGAKDTLHNQAVVLQEIVAAK